MRQSVTDQDNRYATLHRWAYANGWEATVAFAIASLVGLGISFWAGIILSMVAVLLGLLSLLTELLEQGLRGLKRAVRLSGWEHERDTDRDT